MAWSWNRIVWVLVLAFAALVAAEVFGRRGAAGNFDAAAARLEGAEPAAARLEGAKPAGAIAPGTVHLSEILGGAGPRLGRSRTRTRQSGWRSQGISAQEPPALVITGSQAVAWQRSVGRTVSGLSLNNPGDTVRLFQIARADTVEVDAHRNGSIEGASDRSTGRWATSPDSWTLFDALNRYTGSGRPQGTGCAPTPGGPNTCAIGVTGTSWGAIKRLYR